MTQTITLLDQYGMPSDLNYRVAFWLDVPAPRQPYYANPAATSVVKDISPADLAELRAGLIVEKVEIIQSLASATLADVKQAARAKMVDLQRDFNRDNTFNRYGTKWTQASGWVDVVVA
jgi:hypothetical protein